MEARPYIKNVLVTVESSQEEAFQNTVLRQIIKMKHDLLIAHTRLIISRKQKDFNGLEREKQLKFIHSLFEKDQTFRSELRGIIIGYFSIDEYRIYSTIANAINKRMLNIIKKRMIDYLEVLSE